MGMLDRAYETALVAVDRGVKSLKGKHACALHISQAFQNLGEICAALGKADKAATAFYCAKTLREKWDTWLANDKAKEIREQAKNN
jgi:hypothetical protein